MARKRTNRTRESAAQRIEAIRKKILVFDHVCSGTLLERRKVCGKPNCRCATDVDARHGPYFEWTRMVKGKLVHRVLSAEQARFLREAIRNHREILKLLRRWGHETVRVLDTIDKPKT